jgi:hypothetical protein
MAYFIATVVAIVGCYIAAIMIHAWQVRSRAARLLAYIHELHPGVTTEAQARMRLRSFSRYETLYSEDHGGKKVEEVSYEFYNVAEWTGLALRAFPDSWAAHLTLPWTRFAVTVAYNGGVVSEIHVGEMQQDIPGMLHPNSASTTVFSSRLGQQLGFVPLPPSDFTGFSSYLSSTGQVGADGKPNSFSCCHQRWIMLDERATATQLANSLNFHLYCLTSWRRCKDDRDILP